MSRAGERILRSARRLQAFAKGRTDASRHRVHKSRLVLAMLAAMLGACNAGHAQESAASSEKSRLRVIALEAVTLSADARWLGRALFQSYNERRADNSEVAQTALKTALAAVRDPCKGSYRAVLVSKVGFLFDEPDALLVFVIGQAPEDRSVMLGRHYRVRLGPDGKTVRSIVPSTKDCSYLSLSNLTNARYIAHSLSPGATEFHVFLSLLHQAKFRVRTPMGIWEVDNGDIKLIRVDPAYRPSQIVIKDCLLGGTKLATTEEACRKAGGTVLE